MTMGEYIKELRNGSNPYGKKLTQEELGLLLEPKVNRAAINKWETGQVENIKRNHIVQLARIFGITPCELMCFETEVKISKEVKIIEDIQEVFGDDAVELLRNFYNMNATGKEKVMEYINDVFPKYSADKE